MALRSPRAPGLDAASTLEGRTLRAIPGTPTRLRLQPKLALGVAQTAYLTGMAATKPAAGNPRVPALGAAAVVARVAGADTFPARARKAPAWLARDCVYSVATETRSTTPAATETRSSAPVAAFAPRCYMCRCACE